MWDAEKISEVMFVANCWVGLLIVQLQLKNQRHSKQLQSILNQLASLSQSRMRITSNCYIFYERRELCTQNYACKWNTNIFFGKKLIFQNSDFTNFTKVPLSDGYPDAVAEIFLPQVSSTALDLNSEILRTLHVRSSRNTLLLCDHEDRIHTEHWKRKSKGDRSRCTQSIDAGEEDPIIS